MCTEQIYAKYLDSCLCCRKPLHKGKNLKFTGLFLLFCPFFCVQATVIVLFLLSKRTQPSHNGAVIVSLPIFTQRSWNVAHEQTFAQASILLSYFEKFKFPRIFSNTSFCKLPTLQRIVSFLLQICILTLGVENRDCHSGHSWHSYLHHSLHDASYQYTQEDRHSPFWNL